MNNQPYQARYYQDNRERRLLGAKNRTDAMSSDQKAARKEYMRQYRLRNLDKWRRTKQQQDKINSRKRERYAADEQERIKACRWAREWQKANPEKRKAQRLRAFGLSLDQYSEMLQKQSRRCAICGHSDMSNPNFFPLIDHCHETGVVRGLLCLNCNHALGKFKDDPIRLRTAAIYVETSGLFGAVSTQNSGQ
jgi:hypothetical protein